MKQLSQKEFEKCPKWLKKPKTFHSKLETLRYETIPITFHLNFVGEKLFIILSVSVLSVSVSADMKIIISVFYRYWPIWKKAYRSYPDPVYSIKRNTMPKHDFFISYQKNIGASNWSEHENSKCWTPHEQRIVLPTKQNLPNHPIRRYFGYLTLHVRFHFQSLW